MYQIWPEHLGIWPLYKAQTQKIGIRSSPCFEINRAGEKHTTSSMCSETEWKEAPIVWWEHGGWCDLLEKSGWVLRMDGHSRRHSRWPASMSFGGTQGHKACLWNRRRQRTELWLEVRLERDARVGKRAMLRKLSLKCTEDPQDLLRRESQAVIIKY